MNATARASTRGALLLALCGTIAGTASAQGAGALFLQFPFGARTVGRGEAVMADSTLGTEALWHNAAALARQTSKEVAFHSGTTSLGNSYMFSGVVPSRALGTIGAGGYLYDLGNQDATDANGNVTGTIVTHSYLVALSYASAIGKRLNVGISYKLIRSSQSCSGLCVDINGRPFPDAKGSTNALDVGMQFQLPVKLPVTLGAALRNVGQKLQFKDADQADPLPRTLQLGLMTRVPISSLNEAGATLDLSADYAHVANSDASFQALGAALGYREQVFISAGYKRIPGEGGGPSVGVTLQRGAFGLDIARRFDAFSSGSGEAAPTYVSLRARF